LCRFLVALAAAVPFAEPSRFGNSCAGFNSLWTVFVSSKMSWGRFYETVAAETYGKTSFGYI
jgi:hypothetical protein